MTCDGMRLSEYFDGTLDANESLQVEAHVAECEACMSAIGQFHFIRGALQSMRPTPRYHDAVMRSLHPEFARRNSRTRWSYVFVAGAAAALVACAEWYWLQVKGEPSTAPHEIVISESGLPANVLVPGKGEIRWQSPDGVTHIVEPGSPGPQQFHTVPGAQPQITLLSNEQKDKQNNAALTAPKDQVVEPDELGPEKICALPGKISMDDTAPVLPERGTAKYWIARSSELAPLRLKLPQIYFSNTPVDYDSPCLEERSLKQRPAFLVPSAVENLSLNKPVASSDPLAGKDGLAKISDGEKGYQPDFIVKLGTGPQWVQIDLGQQSEIYAIVLWHYYAEDRVYFDVEVQTASDPEFRADVQTIYDNTCGNASASIQGADKEYIESYEGRLIDGQRVESRYIRCFSNGSTGGKANEYIEVEVWGIPIQK